MPNANHMHRFWHTHAQERAQTKAAEEEQSFIYGKEQMRRIALGLVQGHAIVVHRDIAPSKDELGAVRHLQRLCEYTIGVGTPHLEVNVILSLHENHLTYTECESCVHNINMLATTENYRRQLINHARVTWVKRDITDMERCAGITVAMARGTSEPI